MKHKESDLQSSCLKYLETLERLGKIVHYDRLNSGTRFVKYGKKTYRIKLCRAGTFDCVVYAYDLKPIWLEFKAGESKKLPPDQVKFKLKMEEAGHYCFIITSIEVLINYFVKLGINHLG